MVKLFEKIWPYLLGAVMLGFVFIYGPKVIKLNNGDNLGPAEISTPIPVVSNAPVKAIMLTKPAMALYRGIAEGLIYKLKPANLRPTYCEYEKLASNTAIALRVKLGLVLPEGFIIPKDIPIDWIENPKFDTVESYGYMRQLNSANFAYMKRILDRLVDEYAAKTIAVLMEQFQQVTTDRIAGDAATLNFLKLLYGDNFIKDYMYMHRIKDTHSTGEFAIPPKAVQLAEAELTSVWRTEFTNQQLEEVKRFIIVNKVGSKLRDDFFRSSLPEAEVSLMESSILGYRISSMHTLTIIITASYSALANTASN